MKQVQSFVAVLCVMLTAAPRTFAQEQQQGAQPGTTKQDTTPRLDSERPHWYSPFTTRYQERYFPPVNVSNTTRLDSLLRAGKLYLSLQDAVELSLENNIDIEVQRYVFPLAQWDLLRAKTGSSTTGLAGGAGLPGVSSSG